MLAVVALLCCVRRGAALAGRRGHPWRMRTSLATARARGAPPLGQRQAEAAAGEAKEAATNARPPYALSGLPRPRLRGAAMGWLHNTRAWYIVCAIYMAAVAVLLKQPTPADAALRLALVGASSASVKISNGYHNPDSNKEDVTEASELNWLRRDYLSISAILSTNLWLWASNLGWTAHLRAAAWASAVTTSVVGYTAYEVLPRRVGHIVVKLTLAVQFVALLGYLVHVALASPIRACTAVYLCYLPGFVLYATKWPKHPVFGYHEFFHSSVLLGHAASMIFDLANAL